MGIESDDLTTVAEVVRWLRHAPDGTHLDASAVLTMLEAVEGGEEAPSSPEPVPSASAEWSWRERLWTVPAETRLGTTELAEALGRPKSWIYARTQKDADDPIPHRKLDGTLWFTAGETRAWLREREDVPVAGPMESTEAEKRIHVVEGGAA